MDEDMSASLPTDLLVGICRCLDATDLIHCAGVCKSWRRTIIGNALSLRPHPDRFNPNLLLGFFHQFRLNGSTVGDEMVRLQRVQGPAFEFTLPVAAGDTLPSFIPAAAADLSLYERLLSSRDGFLLLEGWETDDLCLCNPMTGYCVFLPDVDQLVADTYVLVTGCNDDGDGDLGVRIYAVKGEEAVDDFLTICYQVFSPTSSQARGAWGPVKRSPEFTKRLVKNLIWPHREIICCGAIHWLGEYYTRPLLGRRRACTFALDVRSSRSWITKLPLQCQFGYDQLVLATSGDGRLSLIRKIRSDTWIQVWVLVGADQWTMRRLINVTNLRSLSETFCPRSGFLHVEVEEEEGQVQELLVDVESDSSRSIRCLNPDDPSKNGWRHPYEMDWSTYLSKMEAF